MTIVTAYTEGFNRKRAIGAIEIIHKPEDIETYDPDWPDNRPFYCTAQGGEFMNWINFEGIICLIDADTVIQRGITIDELNEILPEPGQFTACLHVWPAVKLCETSDWLIPTEEIEVNPKYIEVCGAMLIAHTSDWRKMKEIYVSMFKKMKTRMRHHAMTQWLISWIIQKHFSLKIGPDWLHNALWYNGTKAKMIGDNLYCGKKVIFNHVKQ
jgi:hypothetical protein